MSEQTTTGELTGRLQGVAHHVGRKDRAVVLDGIAAIKELAQRLHDERVAHMMTNNALARALARRPSSLTITRTPDHGQETDAPAS